MPEESIAVLQLLNFATEAERYLTTGSTPAQSMGEQPARDACAVARGYVDLLRLHGEPVNIDDLERVLVRLAQGIEDPALQRSYLTKLRSVVAWSRLAAN